MKKILESKTRIRFQDCDPYNHLNNAKYLNYFINEREDQIEAHYGLNIFERIRTTGKGWVVGSNQIAYIKPANLMEEVLIESKLIHFDDISLRVEMKMWNADKTQLKALLWIRFIYIDVRSQKMSTHEQDLLELYEQVVVPQEVPTFEERSNQIFREIKAG